MVSFEGRMRSSMMIDGFLESMLSVKGDQQGRSALQPQPVPQEARHAPNFRIPLFAMLRTTCRIGLGAMLRSTSRFGHRYLRASAMPWGQGLVSLDGLGRQLSDSKVPGHAPGVVPTFEAHI